MSSNRYSILVHLPPVLWRALNRLAARDNCSQDQAIRNAISLAGGIHHEPGGDSQDAPGSLETSNALSRSASRPKTCP